MIVPQFWKEARRHQDRAKGRPQVTVRRFGWSDTSQAKAVRMAEERTQNEQVGPALFELPCSSK